MPDLTEAELGSKIFSDRPALVGAFMARMTCREASKALPRNYGHRKAS